MRAPFRPVLAGLHLAALWSLAVAQPLFDLLGRNPQFFVARGNTSSDVILFSIGLVLLPPLALLAVELVVRQISRPVAAWLHVVLLGVLAAVLFMQLLDRVLPSRAAVLVPASVLLAAAGAYLYARRDAVRAALTFLAPAPLLVALLFLLVSPVSKVVMPAEEAAAATGGKRSEAPVIVVVFDELPMTSLLDRAGRIDAERFPNFAAFARTSTWYRNTTSVSGETVFAIPALLDGRRPRQELLPNAADHPNNLFTLLGASHTITRTEPVTDLCPERLCGRDVVPSLAARLRSLVADTSMVGLHLALPDDLRRKLPPVDQRWGDFGRDFSAREAERATASRPALPADFDDDRVRRFEDALRRIPADPERPPFAFLHAMVPHEPWTFLPDGSAYPISGETIPGMTNEVFAADDEVVRQALQRHLLQTGYVDRLLGRLVERLKSAGVWDRSLVVVASDHGAGFTPGEHRRFVTEGNAHELAPVPLLIKAPGQRRGRVDDRHMETIDVVPTIAAELGIDVPWELDGHAPGSARNDRTVRIGGVTVTAEDYAARRRASQAKLHDWFGAGAWDQVYASGPRADLLGRAAPRGGRPMEPALEIDGGQGLNAVSLDGGLLPVYLTGSLPNRDVSPLVFAVNGRIAATSRPYVVHGATRFSVVLPPATLRAGSNDLAVYRAAARGERLELLARLGGSSYELVGAPAAPRVHLRGRALPPNKTDVRGYVDSATLSDGALRLYGWAADVERGRVPDSIVVFAGDSLLYAGAPTLRRPDVAEYFKKPIELCGYQIEIGVRDVSAAKGGASALRIYAVVDGTVHPLQLGSGANQTLLKSGLRRDTGVLDGGRTFALEGHEVPIGPNRATGAVESVGPAGPDAVSFSGWAGTAGRRGPASSVVALVGGRPVHVGPPGVLRRDLATAIGPGLQNAGFVFTVPRSEVRGQRLEVYAVGSTGAARLPLPDSAAGVLGG